MTVTGETDRVFLTEFYALPGAARRGRPCRTPREDVAVELQIADAPINSGPQLQDVWPTRAIVCLALVTHIYRRLWCGRNQGATLQEPLSATMYKITAEPGYLRAELFERE